MQPLHQQSYSIAQHIAALALQQPTAQQPAKRGCYYLHVIYVYVYKYTHCHTYVGISTPQWLG